MKTAITKEVKVSVESFYVEKHSQQTGQFVFAYRVHIENIGSETVQLLRRHWFIFDSMSTPIREVEGEGVVGEQPILKAGESHQYTSWSPLRAPLGRMYGTFLMMRLTDHQTFMVTIPAFDLIAPFKRN